MFDTFKFLYFDQASNECVYTVYVRTGSGIKAGTDSKISATFSDAAGRRVVVADLEDWGLMRPGHDYYERGNLDIFTGRGPCLSGPVCRLNLTSDGSGPHHGWYCDSLEVTTTGPHRGCTQSIFYVQQWLALDAPPYQLTAVLDGCSQVSPAAESCPFVVSNGEHHDASK